MLTSDSLVVIMVKSLLLVAILANIIYLVYAGRAQSFAQSSAVSSASSSGSASQSYASANAGASQYGRSRAQSFAQSSAVSSASSSESTSQNYASAYAGASQYEINQEAVACSSAAASASSTSNGNQPPPPCDSPVPSYPRCKGLNEEYDPCPAPCPPQRCDVNIALILCAVPPKLGDPECKPGCRCIEDHVRNKSEVCIPRDQCPTCPNINEVYDPCIAPCPPRRCDVDERLIKCAAPPQIGDPSCVAGCRCDDGFYENSEGVCVTKDECIRCDGPHEYLGCGQPCDNVCATLHEQNQTNCKIYNKRCTEMCYCEEGYARDKNNICIPIEKCDEPRCKGKHQIFSKCMQAECRPKYCFQLGFPVACPKIDPKYCKQGCLCKDGYLLDDYGNCVSVDQCPECGGDCNARAGCGVHCNQRCSDIGKEPKACLAICYNNACDCKKGYVLDDNLNKCVLPEQCTQTCGVNEVFSNCTQGGCRPQNCSQLGFPVACRKIDSKYCKTGCLCKEGFLRDCKGICVPDKQCPSCGGDPNATSGCGKNCGRLCSNYKQKNVVCTLECRINGCDCKKGYVFDTNEGHCVLPKNCLPVCRNDEVYTDYINSPCPVQNCSLIGVTVHCIQIIPKHCIKGCLCKDPFYMREDNGLCIPIAKCKPPVCNKDEVYSNCTNGGCSAKNCSQLGRPVPCIKLDPKYCIKGCLCKDGLLRDEDGKCVPAKKCKNKCNKPNEYYEPCDYNCPPRTCESLDRAYVCPIREGDTCKAQCKCKEGFYRDRKENCITKEQCRMCDKPNEYYACGGACDNVCSDMHKQNQTSCPIINIKCNEKCYCDENYARAKNGTCIPIIKCCEPQCRKNERYEKCPAWLCEPQKCSQLGYPVNCSDNTSGCKCPVKPSCVCVDGYLKDANGTCIPRTKCPSCGGDPNAGPGCGTNCGKKCEDLGKKPGACPKICKLNGCDCKDGYYFNKYKGKCVLPSECNICNKPNEEYVKCPPKCPPQTCESINKKYFCPLMKTNETDCTGECRCINGFYRNLNGECISKSDCLKCPKDHEYFSCGPACDNVCCDLDEQTKDNCIVKNIKCVERCYCEDGYARIGDEKSECVPISDCPAPKCGKNEVVDSCVNGGCGHRNCSQLNGPILCIDPIKCKQGCTCKKGYLREDATGVCVKEEKCPNICNKPNEEYVKCPITCPPQTCESINKTYHCPLIKTNKSDCTGQCRCINGFYRNLNGECISKSNCLKCPKDHEYYSCGPACDNVCCDLDEQTKDNCIVKNIKCVERCYCEDGYARIGDEKSECVPISDCPGRGNPKPTVNTTEAIAYFEDGNTLLSISFLKQLLYSRPRQNIIFSTYSLMNVLGQLVMGAKGDSLDQLLYIMNLDNTEEVRQIFAILIQRLQEQKDVIFQSANKVYGTDKAPYTKSFTQNAKIFDSEVQNINFAENIEAADIINEWVEAKTKGLIKDIANPDMFSSLTRMAIFNCLYFRGNWVHQFNPKSTQLRDFYINAKDKVSIQTMYLKATLKYALLDELNAQALLLPYKGNKFNMLFILPGEDSDLNSLVENLDPDTISMIEDSLKSTQVIAYIPRMDVEFDISDMKDLLIKNNLTAIFKASSDFSGIFENKNEKLYVSDVVQKSAIKLDETGTEAASSTGAIITARSQALVPIQTIFNANRPFILILKYLDSILFCGAIVK